ncbi:hypothetical protein NSQ91_09210 [Paenibacillus sp. FSL R7-0048]|uniref:hypothetical protein n=1 Tax=Paenibacillus TaxID=44249 RepID=UPI00096C8115|nr:hypothetical protein [Paenibacillus odorifer]OMC65710.1 hypothetical protein BK125_29580 [Paenibacillus odorifer]OMD73394.1 hypothetical protein BSK48_05895 [Paenibacillus odorifer]OMD85041.1 hypothetical protein BSK53_08680 [Paenibacillus odorifer]OMD88511.1 hypothetical protein BSK67_26690 [Paenibacillus odorifer]
MKKQLVLSCIIAIILLSGCSNTNNNNPTDANTAINESKNLFNFGEISSKTDTAPSPEKMLREISNFVIADIWNVGFVDVISYTRSGTSSTGASMDIDFTIEQLGKAMEEKKEYDTYMNELDTKYDSIKKIWAKLSPEIDLLYKQIQETPPKANDNSLKLDAGKFNQYSEAFSKEVNDLAKQ